MGKKMKAKPRNPRKIRSHAPSVFPSDRSACAVDDVGVSKSQENCSHYKKEKVELGRILLSVQSSQGVIVSCDHCRDDPPGKKRNKDLGKQSKKKGGVKNVYGKSEASAIWVCLDCSRYFCGGEMSVDIPYGHARRHSKQDRHPWLVRQDDISIAWCLNCDSAIPKEMLEVDTNEDLNLVAETSSSSMKIDNADEFLALGKMKGRVVRGLINLGNTCFFNSVLQNLFALDVMRDYFSAVERSSGPLNMALKKLFMDTCAAVDAKGALNPNALFGSICSKSPQFRGYQQQDSHELLRYLLDGLQTEDTSHRKLFDTCSKSDSNFIDAIFGGRLSSTVSCKACGHSSTIQEPFLDLSLPIPSTKHASKMASLHSSRSRPPPRETRRGQKSREKIPPEVPSTVKYQKPETSCSLSECATSSAPFPEEPIPTFSVEFDCTWMDYIVTDNTTETELDFLSQTKEFVHQNYEGKERRENVIDPTFMEPETLLDLCSEEDITSIAQTSGVIILGYEPLDSSVQETEEISPTCRKSGSMDAVAVPITGCEDNEVEIDGLGDLFNENEATSDLITEPRVDDVDDDVGMIFWSGSNSESNQDEVDDSSSPISINGCLSLFIKPEVLSGEHGWHCESCSKDLDNRNIDIRKGKRRAASEKHSHLGVSAVGGRLKVDKDMDSDGLVVDPDSIDIIENGKFDILMDCKSVSKGKEISIADSESCSISEQPENVDGVMSIQDLEETTRRENLASCVVDSCFSESNGLTLVGESLRSFEDNNAYGIDQGNEQYIHCSQKMNYAKNGSGMEIKSENFKVKRDAVKSFLIYRAPPILTIHLKRFSQDTRGRLSKLRGHIVFQEMIDLKPYMDSRSDGEESCPTTYRLVGVVEHSGGMTDGHYIAYVRGVGGGNGGSKGKPLSWFYASDTHIRETTLSEVLKSEAYLLFYERDQSSGGGGEGR